MFFNKIIIAECGQGQRKNGVESGGKYICDHLNFKPNNIIEYKQFNDINSLENNGYTQLSYILEKYNKEKELTILIGGDHSLGISSVDAFLNIYKEELSVLWIDAHADINDHITSLSGNIHGMSLGYHHIKRCDKPIWRKDPYKLNSNQLYYFGIRDLDPVEDELIKNEKIGYSITIDDNLKKFIDNSKYLLISFDVDVLDPSYMDSTGVMAPNGLYPKDIKDIINYAYDQNKLIHLDLMEFNPLLGDASKSIKALEQIFSKTEKIQIIEEYVKTHIYPEYDIMTDIIENHLDLWSEYGKSNHIYCKNIYENPNSKDLIIEMGKLIYKMGGLQSLIKNYKIIKYFSPYCRSTNSIIKEQLMIIKEYFKEVCSEWKDLPTNYF